MIPHATEIKIFSGNAHKQLAEDVCRAMGIKLGDATVDHFADGEVAVSLYETVRGRDVFLIQPTCKPVNEHLMELLIMIDACSRASAGRITAVIPYFGYARQDRKAKSRDPISAKLVANLISKAGADRVLTMDLHAAQIQGFFDIPVDNLMGAPLFADYILQKFGAEGLKDVMAVSPDVGSVTRTRAFAHRLGIDLAIVDKRRPQANESEVMNIIGKVKGKHVILFDDMIDTAGSLCAAARALVDIGGAKDIYACASHGLLSGKALERIEKSPIKEVALLDTIPYPQDKPMCDKIKYISVAPMFAEAIDRVYEEVSISTLFK
ncbi:MAG: ribose-phosphate pyrophosphokinase [Oscillospiraceae bacterium]|nr:ribose-phosphate pyrophosphokinase [Oscillospiraceae bacterium]